MCRVLDVKQCVPSVSHDGCCCCFIIICDTVIDIYCSFCAVGLGHAWRFPLLWALFWHELRANLCNLEGWDSRRGGQISLEAGSSSVLPNIISICSYCKTMGFFLVKVIMSHLSGGTQEIASHNFCSWFNSCRSKGSSLNSCNYDLLRESMPVLWTLCFTSMTLICMHKMYMNNSTMVSCILSYIQYMAIYFKSVHCCNSPKPLWVVTSKKIF